MMNNPNLKNYIARYNMDTKLLKEHPEKREMLEKRIAEHKENIIRCVTSNPCHLEYDSRISN